MYANESKGLRFPPIRMMAPTVNTTTGVRDCNLPVDVDFVNALTPNGPSIYPEYLTDLKVLVCPSDKESSNVANGVWNVVKNNTNSVVAPCTIHPISYQYYGLLIKPEHYLLNPARVNDTDPAAFDGLLRQEFRNGFFAYINDVETAVSVVPQNFGVFERDITIDATAGVAPASTMFRLKEGIERFLITDINNAAGSAKAQSSIAIMFDAVNARAQTEAADGSVAELGFNHVPGGGNVLYMDGHVSFVKYSTEWPVCGTWANMSAAIALQFPITTAP